MLTGKDKKRIAIIGSNMFESAKELLSKLGSDEEIIVVDSQQKIEERYINIEPPIIKIDDPIYYDNPGSKFIPKRKKK